MAPAGALSPVYASAVLPLGRDSLTTDLPYLWSLMTVNLTRIYTKLGDGGDTHLGDMSRAPKTHPRIEAFGDVDELNSQIGVALATTALPPRVDGWLRQIQNDLFDVGADLSLPPGADEKRERLRINEEYVSWLER